MTKSVWNPDGAAFNAVLAGVGGVFTYAVDPARLSTRKRRALHLVTGVLTGAASAAVLVDEEDLSAGGKAALGGFATAVGVGSSLLGVRADAWLVRTLAARGVRDPRLWMGVGTAGMLLVIWQLDRRLNVDEGELEGEAVEFPAPHLDEEARLRADLDYQEASEWDEDDDTGAP